MQALNVTKEPKSCVDRRHPAKARLAVVGVALLLSLGVVFAAWASSASTGPKRAQWGMARLGWYLQTNQLKAEARTYAAMFRYLLDNDNSPPTVNTQTNRSLVQNASSSSPES
jgi:hypothetical protein